jgi:hypothetical protein
LIALDQANRFFFALIQHGLQLSEKPRAELCFKCNALSALVNCH